MKNLRERMKARKQRYEAVVKKLRDTPNHCFLCKIYCEDGKKVIRRIKKYTKYICNDCIKKHKAKDRQFVIEEKILVDL
jgi:hypothetical protein